MPRVLLYGETTIGASHVASVIDIVLGAFRYCVNEREKDDVPQILLPKVVQLMWHQRVGDKIYLGERGLILRPKEVKVPAYKERYEELIDHLKYTMEVASQQISS